MFEDQFGEEGNLIGSDMAFLNPLKISNVMPGGIWVHHITVCDHYLTENLLLDPI